VGVPEEPHHVPVATNDGKTLGDQTRVVAEFRLLQDASHIEMVVGLWMDRQDQPLLCISVTVADYDGLGLTPPIFPYDVYTSGS
jgi:hypothetical protein